MGAALDEGPFFHGTKAELEVGDLLIAGLRSNYRPEIVMNHIYFTAQRDGAGLAAELAAGDGTPRVYPLRVIAEVDDWTRLSLEALQGWRDRLAALRADERDAIIN
jgi:hypothetical protein